MYGILVLFIREQSSSVISQSTLIGQVGTVTVPIDANGTGEVGISASQQYRAYSARAKDSSAIAKGRQVKVIEASGSILIVEEIK
jgi:membrane-bound ClpP family serine protease